MAKIIVRVIALLAVIALLTVLIPSSVPLVVAEGKEGYPVYSPVTLTAQDVTPIPYGAETPYAPHADAYLPDDMGYLDPSLSVRIETMRDYNTTIMLAWIQIADPTQLRATLYRPYPSKSTAYVDVIAKREQAVLAINGDWFTHRKEGYIVRNGEEPYREYFGRNIEMFDLLVIDENADFHIIRSYNEEKVNDFRENSGHQIIQCYAFGPGLVVDGEMADPGDLTKLGLCAPGKRTQRIAFCQMDTLSYLIVATEGPENEDSTGLTMEEFAQLCADLGVKQAYNFDGGSSSCIVLDNHKINSLSTHKKRVTGDILYFITAVPE